MRYLLLLLTPFTCTTLLAQKNKADLLIYGAKIYTVDARFSTASAMVIKGDRIEAIGNTNALLSKYEATQKMNLQGKTIYPGFIDAHTHFFNYGLGLQTANLTTTHSWEEVLATLQNFAKEVPEGWLLGRGWDQNKWKNKNFPSKEKLDQLFPDRPVVLTRVDGHAVIANQKALDLAGVHTGMQLAGGDIEMKHGALTGILIDNAKELVLSKIPKPTITQATNSLMQAQRNCFEVGLTTVDDCGLDYETIEFIDSLQKSGELKMRIYAMLSDAPKNYAFAFSHGKMKTDYLNVRAFKVYADGALGSRGAALLQPYSDRAGWSGFLLSTTSHFDSVAQLIYQHDWQMCTHAIGDSGNRIILNSYANYLKGRNDKRWRIEHAQVIDQSDFHRFGQYSIIPSVQPTHATSDMYWAGDRLGDRVKGAYAYRQLMRQNGWLPLGTDFPVEDISPFKTFYAAVFRMDAKGYPAGGYQIENALSRKEALMGMTIWAAKSNFEEGEKGSLEKGKLADFVILDHDLMTASAKEVLVTKVLATYSGGKKVYGR